MNESHLGDALHAYLDNELSAERALEARAHLASCTGCQREFDRIRALRGALQQALTPTEPSAAFVRKLQHSVRQADPGRWRKRLVRAAWAAGPLAAAALLLAVFTSQPGGEASAELASEVVAAHLRSLQADHLTDVASSDRHTVKPWFQGKLPYSPPVLDFQAQGLALQGGRMEYLGGQPVAAVVYKSGQHLINAFVWPAAQQQDSAPRPGTGSGLHTLHWVSDGMAWWLVSDVAEAELQRLASLLRAPPQ